MYSTVREGVIQYGKKVQEYKVWERLIIELKGREAMFSLCLLSEGEKNELLHWGVAFQSYEMALGLNPTEIMECWKQYGLERPTF